MPDEPELSKDLQDSLKEICKLCKKEDDEIRKAQVRQWKKHEEFWNGVQYLFWNANLEDWNTPQQAGGFDSLSDDTEDQLGSFSDKVVDIYKAHGESIIAALAAQIPGVRWMPDDADSTEDTITARTYSKIGDLIDRHNKTKLVFLKALFYLANHGVCFSYRYKESDLAYGSYKVPKYGVEEQEQISFVCKDCDYESDQDWTGGQQVNNQQEDTIDQGPSVTACPQCGSVDKPKKVKQKIQVPVMEGVEEKPKTRVKLDIFGALHVKVPYYARNQKECTYLILSMDQGKDVLCDLFPDMYDDIQQEEMTSNERFTRSNYTYPTDEEVSHKNLSTVERYWLRPAAFNRETREEKRKKLQKKYPQGCKVTLIGKQSHFAEAKSESLDEKWEIGQSGISTYIYTDPILRPLIQIQEMRNDLVNLIIETIKHGIPSEFADPSVVNFDTYNRFEAVPGYIYQTKAARPGEPIGNSFYTSSRSMLSREVAMFLKQLDQDAQFAIGSFPSIYGGPSEGKSRTFAEYAASRQMALQRLSIVWTLIVDWWVRTKDGCVNMYISTVVEDEKFSKFQDGNYINVWIKRAELQGKVGGCEPEAGEGIPMSMAQKADKVMKFIELNNPFINNALYKPENARLIQDIMGLTEFKLPGEEQRIKQVIEINEMIKTSQVLPIDSNVDDAQVHIGTLISFMVDLPGLDLQREQPEVYTILTQHLQMHQQDLMMKTMSAQGGTPPGAEPKTAEAGVEE